MCLERIKKPNFPGRRVLHLYKRVQVSVLMEGSTAVDACVYETGMSSLYHSWFNWTIGEKAEAGRNAGVDWTFSEQASKKIKHGLYFYSTVEDVFLDNVKCMQYRRYKGWEQCCGQAILDCRVKVKDVVATGSASTGVWCIPNIVVATRCIPISIKMLLYSPGSLIPYVPEFKHIPKICMLPCSNCLPYNFYGSYTRATKHTIFERMYNQVRHEKDRQVTAGY